MKYVCARHERTFDGKDSRQLFASLDLNKDYTTTSRTLAHTLVAETHDLLFLINGTRVHSRVSRDREESVRWARPSFPTLAPPRRLEGGWAAAGRAAARCCRAASAEAATAVGTADSRAWLAAWRHKVAAVGARGSGGHPCVEPGAGRLAGSSSRRREW